jgi:hypothetical protein
MAHCLSCYSYVLQETAACASCPENRGSLWVVKDEHPDIYALRKGELRFRYNMIKGKLAETLVEQLFLSHKYNVFRYGMEHTLPGIADSLKRNKTATARQIKTMPDLVIQHRIDKETYFVEVKFKANGCFNAAELQKDYAYDDALIIVVSKRHIKCLSVRELRQGQEITENSYNYLADRKEFHLRRDVVVDFCEFAKTFFEAV